jgi:hypothetical protein
VKQPAFSEIVDRLHSCSAKGDPQSENREFVAQRPDESVWLSNPIPILLGQRGARNDDFSFKSATQMLYELNDKSTICL